MGGKQRGARTPRRPIGREIEALEPRELMSAIHRPAGPGPAHARIPARPAAERALADVASASPSSSSRNPGSSVDAAGTAPGGNSTAASTSGSPTPHERARENFTAVFYGPYVIGPARFTGDSSQTYTNSGGTSSSFLHGNLQLGFETPTSPSQGPTGTATLYPKNYLMTGSYLVLELQGSPANRRDGRATSFTYTVHSSSSGMYSNASGSGTVQLIYHPGPHGGGILHAHGFPTGNVSVIFRGTLILDGTVNPLRLNAA